MLGNPIKALRRTLLARGVPRKYLPQTRLAQLTAYFVAFALLFGVVELLGRGTGVKGLQSFGSLWWQILSDISLVLLLLLLLRWMRQRFLWSLRRRLFLTYFFIGIIPLVLVVLMALTAAYLFAGQFATYIAVAQIRSQFDTMDTANGVLASSAAKAPTAAAMLKSVPELLSAMPANGVRNAVWLNGKLVAAQPQAATDLPGWIGQSQRIIAVQDGKLYARVVRLSDVPAGKLAVVSSADVDPAIVDRVAKSVGEIRVFIPDFESSDQNWDLEAKGNAPDDSNRRRLTIQGDTKASQPRKRPRGRGADIVAGTLPPPARFGDNTIAFATPYDMVEWSSGKHAPGLLAGRSRYSVLYPELSAGLEGRWANFILGALAAIAIAFGVIELIAFFIGIRLSHSMTSSIANLYKATQHIKRADFSHRIEVRGEDQLAELQRSFNVMTEDIERLIVEQKEKEKLQNELAIAQEVQDQLFPHDPKGLSTLEVHGVCKPARTVSGDYYDFVPFGLGKLGIAVGDISGKGISAALMMATVHSAVRAYEVLGNGALPALTRAATVPVPSSDAAVHLAHATQSPASALTLLNRHLYETTPLEKYATLFLGIYDEHERSLVYANGGHLPPLVVSPDGSVRKLDSASGLMVGLFDHPKWEDAEIQLRPGDLFVAFSDGVIEPENEFGEFGTERLLEIVRPERKAPLPHISEQVIQAVADWIGASEQPDDITLVLARVR